MASSSTSIASPKLYDAFISHRGPDVKETLAKQLYHHLQERGCRAFLDRPEIQVGDSIPFAIRNGICSSLVQIAIFSQGYATSSWCLDELVLMLEQKPNALFIPVFYDVQPWELRHIENEQSKYAAAFSYYRSKGRYLDKLDEWRKALESAADISGFELSHIEHQDLCQNIVSRVLQEVQERKNRIPLDVAKYPVALAELVEDFESCCSETRRHERPKTVDKVMIAGIYGLGGSGKTTLAKELFNRKRSGYHASSFLSDVRESHANRELQCLQSQLLKDLLKIEDLKISSVHHGIGELKDLMGRARHLHFLIVLDDIDHQDQLDALLPQGMLSSSSLIIITTRDQSLLRGADILYKMKLLNRDHARDLFCSHAFRGLDPPIAYERMVESFLEFCGDLPLSLKVLGAHLDGRDEYYWELKLEKAKKIQPMDIMQSLKISFDGLDQEEKQIFIDIACLFNKKWISINNVILIWEASGWNAKLAVQTLQDKCLVQVENHNHFYNGPPNLKMLRDDFQIFEMHDHIRDLGRQMADEMGPPRLWRPHILRDMEEKGFKQILAETKGRCFHSFKDSSLKRRKIVYFIGNSNDSAKFDLLWLEIHDVADKLKDIPSWIPLQKLQYLYVGRVEEIWSTFQQQLQINTQASFELRKLQILEYSSSQKLPGLRGMLSHLEELEIDSHSRKTDMASLLKSIKKLSTLRSLKLISASGLLYGSTFNLSKVSLENSTSSHMTSLETIEFTGLNYISELLISGKVCPRLRSLRVAWIYDLNKVDLKQLERLNTLEVRHCVKLETISGLSSLTGLQSLTVERCHRWETIPGLSSLTGLHQFIVEVCEGLKLLPSHAHLRHLERLFINGCHQLQSVEGFEEWQGLKSLRIEVPDNGYAWVQNCIYGLRRLPSEYIFLIGNSVDKAASILDVNLFSELIGVQGVTEMESRSYTWGMELDMRSSSSAITIYVLLVKLDYDNLMTFGITNIFGNQMKMVTVLLPHHNSEGIQLQGIKIIKGFKVIVNEGEERKALILIQRFFDRLYREGKRIEEVNLL
ncbi:disease resistance protein Roq1 isoform X2 [Cryptomeria japonica]|uniref:disease resistance protein Roq1 isoform X2 n=1 Tax=Cryptomeria japonica TaxID=3369 RepID=UPI0027D9DB27|nr:disease resistance protein Roq1 isoform X2 [Cryptomeria japonica]